ncbi:MAG: deoxyribodipyrimidine photo-lyase, partial [Actinomycetota bacterium]
MTGPSIIWFRRDLRLADNPALVAAARDRPVVALFVLDETLHRPAGANRRAFLRWSLDALDDATGGALVVRWGDPAQVVPEVAAETGAQEVLAATDYGPYGARRDERVAEVLAAAGRRLVAVDSPYAVPPGSLTTGAGTPFKVFTPYYRAWRAVPPTMPLPEPDVEWVTGVPSDELPPAPTVTATLPPAGEDAAMATLDRFLADGIDDYDDGRDRL